MPSSDKETLASLFKERLKKRFAVNLKSATNRQKYHVLSELVFESVSENWLNTKTNYQTKRPKEVYYFSMEFLLGRLISSNIDNLGVRKRYQEALRSLNIDLTQLEDIEVDAGLGTGGLGRLAACFLDSMASLGLPGHGNGIRYHYGLFKQEIENGYQIEKPDDWLKDTYPWELRLEAEAVDIPFGGTLKTDKNRPIHHPDEIIRAVPYDIPVVGAANHVVNTLRLWHAEPTNVYPRKVSAIEYDRQVRAITGFLYPDDTTDEGKILRIKQQYFFSAAGMNSILNKHYQTHQTLKNLSEYKVFQINDTHPSLIIPEMMRIMMDDHHMPFEDAWHIVRHTCAYTNHTLLAEALEKWPIHLFKPTLPRIYQIIEMIDRWFNQVLQAASCETPERLRIIHHDQVHMAHLAIVGSFSVNGVAKLHTNLLKSVALKPFYTLMPEKFNNKTNGITHRRWLQQINPELSQLLTDIAPAWDVKLETMEQLLQHADDAQTQQRFATIKLTKKKALADYIKKMQNIDIDATSIFDIQVKRLHEYKRQLMNALHILIIYQRLKNDAAFKREYVPHTFIFGAKAASTYYYAKKIIKLINTIAHKINNDSETNQHLKVVFVHNYNVTYAERIMPACDISEQISTASKEASGTGNMKFMMNGAITLGTLDGANVEIAERVGADNIIIFGMDADTVKKHTETRDYNPQEIIENNTEIKQAIDCLTNGFFDQVSSDEFSEIRDKLLYKDQYYVLKDLESYLQAHHRANEMYKDRTRWLKACLVNIAKSHYFSSDRTIQEYARDIWNIKNV